MGLFGTRERINLDEPGEVKVLGEARPDVNLNLGSLAQPLIDSFAEGVQHVTNRDVTKVFKNWEY